MLSYILADNEHCKQMLLAQESQTSQNANGIQNQNALLLSIVSGICAMGTHLADVSNGREKNLKVYWQDVTVPCTITATGVN